jgi:predicted RND superfamily exporter protein
MCMVVGLTVDYVVHLAEGYHMSKRDDRKSRVQDMLEIMGISVFSGACTTLGASVFMFFAQIQFIIRFGMFMFSTIGFSLLYSLAFFTTIMGILGPNGNQGDIKVICNHVANKCRRLHRKT